MKNRYRILSAATAVAIAASLLAGCSGSGASSASASSGSSSESSASAASSASSAAASGKKITITYEYWGSADEIKTNNEIVDAFEKKYPDIEVKQVSATWNDYFTKLQTQFTSGTAPDVMFLTYVSTYAGMGVLQDLTPLFQKYNFDINKYPKGLVDSFTVDGKVYGVPRDNDTKVLYYNKKLFQRAGVAAPAKGWTTDQFVADAQKLTATAAGGKKQYGLLFDPGIWSLFTILNQGKFFDNDENPTKVALDDPNTVSALQFEGDLINKYKVTPSYSSLNDGNIRSQLFTSGQAAMLIDNAAQLPTFAKASGLSWDVAYLPVFKGKPIANVGGGAGYTIYSKTKQLDASWKLWEFLNTTGVQINLQSGSICPANEDLLNSSEFKNKNYDAQVFIDETKAAVSLPTAKKWWNVYSDVTPFLQTIWTGSSTASSAVQKAVAAGNKELKS